MELDKGFFITGCLNAAGIIPMKLVVEAGFDFLSKQKGKRLSEKIAFVKSFFELSGTYPFSFQTTSAQNFIEIDQIAPQKSMLPEEY